MMLSPTPTGSMQQDNTKPAVQPVTKRCVAIVNPAGANGKSKKLWLKLSKHVKEQLTAQGYALEERFTSGPGTAARLASEAAAADADVVLAVGGDGTIHEVVSGLVRAQQQQQQPLTALAVLPLGTGSDYARTFGWRLNDAAAACQRILSGEQQLADVSIMRQQQPTGQQSAATTAAADAAAADVSPHTAAAPAVAADAAAAGVSPHTAAAAAADAADADAGQRQAAAAAVAAAVAQDDSSSSSSSSRYVINVASCAVGALSAARAGSLKQLGTLCYPLGGALTLLDWKGCSIQVCLDDSKEWLTLDKLTTLVLGQGRFWGGGLQILPQADPTDGLMDVVALQGLGLWDFISKGHLLRTGQHVKVKGVNVLGRCRRLQVKAAADSAPLAWECDGEPQGQFEAVDIQVLPGALRLLSGKPGTAGTAG